MKREELKEMLWTAIAGNCHSDIATNDAVDKAMVLIDEYTKPKTKQKGLKPNWSKIIPGFNKQTEFTRWMVYRKSLGKTIKVQETQDRLAHKFNDTDIETIRKVVNHSIDNQYQGLFWDKFKTNETTATKTNGISDADLERFINS